MVEVEGCFAWLRMMRMLETGGGTGGGLWLQVKFKGLWVGLAGFWGLVVQGGCRVLGT